MDLTPIILMNILAMEKNIHSYVRNVDLYKMESRKCDQEDRRVKSQKFNDMIVKDVIDQLLLLPGRYFR